MPHIRVLEVAFNLPLKHYQIPAFRGGVIRIVGHEHVAFHNHIGEKALHYKYPAIQYKLRNGKAAMFCLEEGVEELYNLFQNKSLTFDFNGKEQDLKIDNIAISKPFLQVWDKWFHYKITDWLPLNGKNFKTYTELSSEIEKQELLERILKGNILSMAKAINWTVDKEIKVQFTGTLIEKSVKFKGVNMKAFIAPFKTNVFIPNRMGLGKGASIGYGVVTTSRNN